MPRSNKKKNPQKPPPKHPPQWQPPPKLHHPNSIFSPQEPQALQSSTAAIASLLKNERTIMISRAIISAKKHGIKLIHGSSNPGTGDCAFESIIQNINNRPCFQVKFMMPVDYYRKIWVTDMANRTVDSPWNILSHQQWMQGWKEMLTPGAYERGIFGDLMLPGIACGVRKYLLIFNTNIETPHDPIYVVDPTTFGVNPDSELPLVLSYNLSHYESMHPLKENDMQVTVDLVKAYLGGRYKFGRRHLPSLIGIGKEQLAKDIKAVDDRDDSNVSGKFTKIPILLANNQSHYESMHPRTESNVRETIHSANSCLEGRYTFTRTEFPKLIDMNRPEPKIEEVQVNKYQSHQTSSQSLKISNNEDFEETLEEDKKHIIITKDLVGTMKEQCKKTESNPEEVKIVKLYYTINNSDKKYFIKEVDGKSECPICRIVIKNVMLHLSKNFHCRKDIDMGHFAQIYQEFTEQTKKEKERLRQKNCRNRKKQESPESYLETLRVEKQDLRKRKQMENKESYLETNKVEIQKLRKRKQNENNEAYLETLRVEKQDLRKRKQDENKESYLETIRVQKQGLRKRKQEESEESHLAMKKRNKQDNQKYRKIKDQNVNELERRRRFHGAVLFGPIFICSCCHRKMYENGVTKLTCESEINFDKTKTGFYRSCIPKDILVKINLNGTIEKTGYYICHTCKSSMKIGKIPSMSVNNGLRIVNIEQNCHLTELENNLIAQNINFQYIFCLQKSRWGATKKQMISVPVTQETVLNTVQQLPRIPREAGLVEVKLKRKKIYEGCHKKEYVDPLKIFKVLEILRKSGHPYYQFYGDLNEYEKRCKEQDFDGHKLLFDKLEIR